MIKEANENEIEFIYKLLECYDKNIRKHYNLYEYLNNDIYNIYVYELNGKIVGVIIFTILYNEAEIFLVFVDKEYRNKSIASKLINNIRLFNVKSILLEVFFENFVAINLYKKLGFKVINIRKDYYDNGSAYVMRKDI